MSTETSSNVVDSNRDVEPFRCEKCGTPFTTGDDLRRHTQLTHKGIDTKAKATRRTATRKRESVKYNKMKKKKSENTTKPVARSVKGRKGPRRGK